jgi:hypothetical protein
MAERGVYEKKAKEKNDPEQCLYPFHFSIPSLECWHKPHHFLFEDAGRLHRIPVDLILPGGTDEVIIEIKVDGAEP